jgi:hypothetical protein
MATWVFGTYLFPMFQAYPYLWLTSPEPGCGKSLLGQILANLSFNGEFMASPTEANMFHLPEQNRGVQVWDEVEFADQLEKSRFQSVKAVLLNGYRNGGVVPRQVGSNWDKQVKYHVFCPRVLIGLSQLPETARQRSIELRLRKRTSDETVELYRVHDHAEEERSLREDCLLMALKCAEGVNRLYIDGNLRKQVETLLGKAGREADDIWLPQFAVAAACSFDGDFSPTRNRFLGDLGKAALEMTQYRDQRTAKLLDGQFNPYTAKSDKTSPVAPTQQTLALALDVLARQWRPLKPSEVAEQVSKRVGTTVTTQWLSKNLARLGIRAKKLKGKRVFDISTSEFACAEGRLGINCRVIQPAAEHGHQGHEGQQSEEI